MLQGRSVHEGVPVTRLDVTSLVGYGGRMPPTVTPKTRRALELLKENTQARTRTLLAEEGHAITETALAKIASRAGIRRSVASGIPWVLRPEHRNYTVPMRLRDLARRKAGAPLREEANRLLDLWLTDLKATDEVYAYNPDAENVRDVFHKVARRYAPNGDGVRIPIDTGWIRDPRLNDDGSPKE